MREANGRPVLKVWVLLFRLRLVQGMLLIIKFMGGKFRDLEANHENIENWHLTKMTHYTVCLRCAFKICVCIAKCNSN